MAYILKVKGDPPSKEKMVFFVIWWIVIGIIFYLMVVQVNEKITAVYDSRYKHPPEVLLSYVKYFFILFGSFLAIVHIWEAFSWRLYVIKLTDDKIYLRHGLWRRTYDRQDVIGINNRIFYNQQSSQEVISENRRLRLDLRSECKLSKKVGAWVDVSSIHPDREKLIHRHLKNWIAATPR